MLSEDLLQLSHWLLAHGNHGTPLDGPKQKHIARMLRDFAETAERLEAYAVVHEPGPPPPEPKPTPRVLPFPKRTP